MGDLVTARLVLHPMTGDEARRLVAGEPPHGDGLVPSARGRGYASEALRALLVCARVHGVTCVRGDADHENIASHHVMTAAGMRPVGEDERVTYFEIAWTGGHGHGRPGGRPAGP
ncbi:GNAT family N-acetyltransferase [Streptomyces lavendulae]|uniref:GNAT family N-acetyltransferase n=1 Tax=Streptomyces lavendulae TaxID=1914 RepID=UPI0033F17AEA